jgi:hypothetical protein
MRLRPHASGLEKERTEARTAAAQIAPRGASGSNNNAVDWAATVVQRFNPARPIQKSAGTEVAFMIVWCWFPFGLTGNIVELLS